MAAIMTADKNRYPEERKATRMHWAIRLRKRLLMPFRCKFNGWVRGTTAWLETHV